MKFICIYNTYIWEASANLSLRAVELFLQWREEAVT